MNVRKHLTEAATLIVAAILCAVVANALASRDRKMALAGNYPNALKVPQAAGAAPAPIAGTRFDTTANEISGPAATTTMKVAVPNTASATTPVAPTVSPAPSATAATPAAPVAGSPRPAPATSSAAASPATPAAPSAGIPATRPSQPATPDNSLAKFAPHEKQPFLEIHGDDVAYLHSKGVLFLDARRTSVYEAGHIAGAQPYSVWEADVDDKVNKLFETRGSDPKQANEPIVIYCSGGDCEDSHMLAQKLWGVQFNNVYVYKDGFPDWEKRGGAVHRGPNP